MNTVYKKIKMNRKGLAPQILIIIAIGLILYFGFGNPGAIIYKSDANTIYQYSGQIPEYLQPVNGREECVQDKGFADNDIVFSQNQKIIIGSNNYEFISKNVRYSFAKDSRESGGWTNPCSRVIYDVSVYKNGQKLEDVNFPDLPASCSELLTKATQVRDYGEIKATFGFTDELIIDRFRCSPPGSIYAYTIHKYEIVQNQSTNYVDPKTSSGSSTFTATPNNNKIIKSSKSFFSSIINFFKGLFSWL